MIVDRLTREQMIAEFGEPGVENPRIVDLIELDQGADRVVLVMIERRGWGGVRHQFAQIEEKINRYLGYALDGHLADHYPQYRGKRIQIRLECAQEPWGDAVRFVKAADEAIRAQGVDFTIEVRTKKLEVRS
jgi:hypothetical protein